MAQSPSDFVWYELMTTDTEAAEAFYAKVVGWGTQDGSKPGMAYTLFTQGETQVSGMMELPAEARTMGVPPHWLGYVAVDDVDAATEQVKRLGGAVHVPPQDIPDIGRFSVVADPQTAALALFKSANPAPIPPVAPGTPGHIGWHELYAVDWEKELVFYGDMFGWQKAEAVDMGPMGTYQLFGAGGPPIGGMFNKPAEVPVPFWLYYFNVADIDAATERLKTAGGQVLNGPMEVPGGDWIVQALDPQGAMFALAGKRS
ncbi:VOC family protein [Phreatobacter stygius]|uniref:VOC family protein n=1 Tax=Phreatobacter stygius TaxID=1940610 RepID=A0A4D7B1F2_9HYPH|nr:VOC family protein [Phreatobacter stygius]QCI67444.1 VOC family protein [Phreatobacter stygius]